MKLAIYDYEAFREHAKIYWPTGRLRDVLKACGMEVDKISLGEKDVPVEWSVGLRGYDHDEVGNHYCCSFPFDKAIDPFGDVILAYQMNGVDIPRSYGYPVRAIVPGRFVRIFRPPNLNLVSLISS